MEPLTAKESISLVASLLKEAEKQGLFDKLGNAFKKKPRILLLGCTGTGKSNFLESLTNAYPVAIKSGDRTMYTEAKRRETRTWSRPRFRPKMANPGRGWRVSSYARSRYYGHFARLFGLR